MADAPIPSQFAFSGFDLTGKVAFVTGGGSGLGKAIATGLHQAGATVVIGSRSAEKLSATAAEIGARCSTLSVDTCDRASVAGAFEHIDAAYGKLDILVNAAGILHRAKAEEETVESFEKVMKTNVTGVFSCCQLAAKRMQEQASGGCILNIASLTSFVALSDVTSYACSKAAVMQMTKQLASDWARYNIRVNAIAPGECSRSQSTRQHAGVCGHHGCSNCPAAGWARRWTGSGRIHRNDCRNIGMRAGRYVAASPTCV